MIKDFIYRLQATDKVRYVTKDRFDDIDGKDGTSPTGIPQKEKDGVAYRVKKEKKIKEVKKEDEEV